MKIRYLYSITLFVLLNFTNILSIIQQLLSFQLLDGVNVLQGLLLGLLEQLLSVLHLQVCDDRRHWLLKHALVFARARLLPNGWRLNM